MLRRLSLLFVGVIAAVGVGIRGLELAPALPTSKHWPMTGKLEAVGVAAVVGVLLAVIWLMRGFSPMLAHWCPVMW